jgi:hypothetical protein
MRNKKIMIHEEFLPSIPKKADEFFAFWRGKIDLIPKEFRDSAAIEIEHDQDCLEISVSYLRPETELEANEREQRNSNWDAKSKARRLDDYNRLKAEFGGDL